MWQPCFCRYSSYIKIWTFFGEKCCLRELELVKSPLHTYHSNIVEDYNRPTASILWMIWFQRRNFSWTYLLIFKNEKKNVYLFIYFYCAWQGPCVSSTFIVIMVKAYFKNYVWKSKVNLNKWINQGPNIVWFLFFPRLSL